MADLHVMCGIPGCGKSTVADQLQAEHDALIVSPDTIRQQVTGNINDQSQNAAVFAAAHKLTRAALGAGENVIFDATSVNPRSRKELLEHARVTGSGAHLHLFNTPLDTAKQRNLGRERSVPSDVLDRMHGQLLDSLQHIPAEGWDEIHHYE